MTERNPLAWYPEDAREMLTREDMMVLSAVELGVLTRIRWACWVYGSVPRDRIGLGRVAIVSRRDLSRGLTDRVMAHLRVCPDDSARLTCPEIDRLRDQQLARRARQVEGGRATAAARWGSDRSPSSSATATRPLRAFESASKEGFLSRTSFRTREKEELTDEQRAWVADYQRYEAQPDEIDRLRAASRVRR